MFALQQLINVQSHIVTENISATKLLELRRNASHSATSLQPATTHRKITEILFRFSSAPVNKTLRKSEAAKQPKKKEKEKEGSTLSKRDRDGYVGGMCELGRGRMQREVCEIHTVASK